MASQQGSNADAMFATAMQHYQAGRVMDAAQVCTTILQREPRHYNSLYFLGFVALMSGRHEMARDLTGRAIAINDQNPELHYNIGLACWGLRELDEAARHYQRALALLPAYAEAANNLGNVWLAQGKTDAALGQFQLAVALKPMLVEPYKNLAKIHVEKGNDNAALSAAMRALTLRDSPEMRAAFVECVRHASSIVVSPEVVTLVARAFAEDWGRTDDLSNVAIPLVKSDAVLGPSMERVTSAWPQRLAAAEFDAQRLAAIASHDLLFRLMQATPIADVAIERLLTSARAVLLDLAAGAKPDTATGEPALRFHCALARQCFLNEYVYTYEDAEFERAERLRDALVQALQSNAPVSPQWIAAVASYFPLHAVAGAERLLTGSWPPAVEALLTQQLREPAEEARLRTTIPTLTPIEQAVSVEVRRQYEENPYPRWQTTAVHFAQLTLTQSLRQTFPSVEIHDVGRDGVLDVLVAGCGTGRQPIEAVQRLRDARVLAVDLSLTSLSFAKRVATAAGVLPNIEFGLGDLLQIGTLGRSFDYIEVSGVLHHLDDPWQGWRTLLGLLRPHGAMCVGLYSELARAHHASARQLIADRGYSPSPNDIRRFRQELMAFADGTPERKTAASIDFFSVSGCRDLLFHVRELRMTLPEIREFLAANELRFLGFALPAAVLGRFRTRFGSDHLTDLDRWHEFETENPDTFAGMYQFYVQKN